MVCLYPISTFLLLVYHPRKQIPLITKSLLPQIAFSFRTNLSPNLSNVSICEQKLSFCKAVTYYYWQAWESNLFTKLGVSNACEMIKHLGVPPANVIKLIRLCCENTSVCSANFHCRENLKTIMLSNFAAKHCLRTCSERDKWTRNILAGSNKQNKTNQITLNI